jgi:hypothetical protein
MKSKFRAFVGWALHTEASTRSAALIRIGLLSLVWTRWANDMVLFRHLEDGLWPVGLWFFLTTPLALFGFLTRISVPAAASAVLTLVYYVGHARGVEGYTHHHTTLLAWALVWLSFTPCGKSYSFDRWLTVRKAERRAEAPPPERANVWGLRVLALQTAAVYFWGAVDKCNFGFLSGARMAHYAMYYYSGSTAFEDIPGLETGLMLLAVGTVILEFALAFGMLWPRTRRWLIVPGLLLHGVFYMFLSVFTFTVTMWVLYLAYFDPDDVQRFIERLEGGGAPQPKPPDPLAT